MSNFQKTLREAVGLHQDGKLDEAVRLYEAALRLQPRNFDALRLFGILNYQLGQHETADRLLAGALKLNPKSMETWSNHGLVLQALRRPLEALANYDKAIALSPGHGEVYTNRGNVLYELKRVDEALASFEKAIALNASSAVAHNNLGSALRHAGRLQEALSHYDKAIAINPDYVDAYLNRAFTLIALDRPEDAIKGYREIVERKPNDGEVHKNAGFILVGLNSFEQAFASFNRAISLQPNLADAHNGRGFLLKEARRYKEALESFDRAIAIKPSHSEAHRNRAYVLFALKQPDAALAAYEQVIALDPQDRFAFGGIANTALHACDWPRTRRIAEEIESRVAEGNSVIEPFALLGYSASAQTQLKCAQQFSRFRAPVVAPPLPRRAGKGGGKIRIAYLSADFRIHPVAYQVAELFELHDKNKFEITGVSFGIDDASAMRKRLIAAFDEFIDVRDVSDSAIASLLQTREIDIAIDLMGFTTSERAGILAHRPAPVQAQFLGFPGTMASSFIDYIIADPIILPRDQQASFTEKIVHLPDCYMVNDSTRAIAPETPSRQLVGLPDDGFVFCCFNSNYKITSAFFDIWMRLLAKVEGSVLWLARDNDTTHRNLISETIARGIDPARIVFAERVGSPEQHLARHRAADLFLDTLPYNAHSTGSSALWAGLPFITCMGETMQSRVGASLLRSIGLPELVTHSLDEYESLAEHIARNPSELERIRLTLQKNLKTFPLFDTERFRRQLEAAYFGMWERYQEGKPPEGFSV